MLKKILLALVAISLFFAFTSASETGIKFAINTQLLNLVKKIDYSKKFSNTTLIGTEGVSYVKNSFPSVSLKASNLTITKFENPDNVEVETNMADKSLKLHLKNIKVNLQVSYELRVVSLLKDSGKNTNIDIALDEFVFVIQFLDNKISIKDLKFKIAKIDFSLNQVILNFILKIFKNTIISKLNQSVDLMRVSMEQKLNQVMSSEKLIDLAGMGIGVNATITEKPNMELFDKNSFNKVEKNSNPLMQIFVDIVQEILEVEQGKKIIILAYLFYKNKKFLFYIFIYNWYFEMIKFCL